MWSAASAIPFQTAIYTRLTLQQCKSCASTETTEVWRPWPAGWGNGGGSDSFSLSTPQTWHRVTPPGWLIYLCSCLSVQLSAGPRSHEPFIHQLLLSTSDIIGVGGRKVLFALTFMNGIISVRFLLDLDLETSESVSDCVNEWNQKQQKSSN